MTDINGVVASMLEKGMTGEEIAKELSDALNTAIHAQETAKRLKAKEEEDKRAKTEELAAILESIFLWFTKHYMPISTLAAIDEDFANLNHEDWAEYADMLIEELDACAPVIKAMFEAEQKKSDKGSGSKDKAVDAIEAFLKGHGLA